MQIYFVEVDPSRLFLREGGELKIKNLKIGNEALEIYSMIVKSKYKITLAV